MVKNCMFVSFDDDDYDYKYDMKNWMMLDLEICSNIEDDDVAVTTLCIIPSNPHILYNCCRFIIHF